LIDWLAHIQPPPAQVFINHGEADAAAALTARIEQELDLVAVMPEQGERVRV